MTAPSTSGSSEDAPAGVADEVSERSTGSLGSRAVTAAEPAGDTATPAAASAAPVPLASDEAPVAPPAPSLPTVPSTTVGGTGCSSHGATEGAQRGGTAAAVLGSPLDISSAVNDAGHTAPAAGSPITTATDPATRPD